MKTKFLFIAFAALALAACENTNNSITDIDPLPEGRADDLGCDINIMQSATKILGLSEESGVNYLLNAGWREYENSPTGYRLFICKDTVNVLSIERGWWALGPRTRLSLGVEDGTIKGTSVMSFYYPSEKPFHHIVEWDAWLLHDWKDFRIWNARTSTGSGYRHYNILAGADDYYLFCQTLSETDEEDIESVSIKASNSDMSVNLNARRQMDMDMNMDMVLVDMRSFLLNHTQQGDLLDQLGF